MSDSVSTSVPANAPENREPTTTEIDARHARQLVERAFAQLERGDRAAAEVAIRQAIHLSPGVPVMHSLAGLMALLDGDAATARIAYENAVTDFSKASPERERLIALRMVQADHSRLDADEFVPNLPAEIARLRAMMQATSPQEFLSQAPGTNSALPRLSHNSPTVAPTAAPSPAIAPPLQSDSAARPDFAARLEQRKRASAWAVAIAAVSAAIVAFFVMRSLVAPRPVLPVGSTPNINQVAVENAAPTPTAGAVGSAGTAPETPTPNNSATENPDSNQAPATGVDENGSTPTPTPEPPAPTATVTVKPMPPVSATPRPAPKPTPTPANKPAVKTPPPAATPVVPRLPRPAPKPPTVPHETPAAVPAPRDPNFPAMPPPKITLPSAGGEKTEFPRVLPDND